MLGRIDRSPKSQYFLQTIVVTLRLGAGGESIMMIYIANIFFGTWCAYIERNHDKSSRRGEAFGLKTDRVEAS